MLQTDNKADMQKVMVYPETYVLYSVIDFGMGSLSKKYGYFAVG